MTPPPRANARRQNQIAGRRMSCRNTEAWLELERGCAEGSKFRGGVTYREGKASIGLCQSDGSNRSANDEALLVQQDPVPGSEFYLPVTRALIVNGGAAIGTIAACGVGENGKLDHPAQPVAAIPAMLDCCNRRRLDPRVEEERARIDWKAWGNAVPAASAG